MTLSKKYEEIMDHIKVTPEMGKYILEQMEPVDFTKPGLKSALPVRKITRFAALAASLAVVLTGIFFLRNPAVNSPISESPTVIASGNGIVEVASEKELAEQVGFEINGLTSLPFQVEDTIYTAYWKSLAEITYNGEGQTAVYRKGYGSDDVSGDYTSYAQETELKIGNTAVTLKGDDTGYRLATWTDGTYSYSISLSQKTDTDGWKDILEPFLP